MKHQLNDDERLQLKAELATMTDANGLAEGALAAKGVNLTNPLIALRLQVQALVDLVVGDNDDLALQYHHAYQRMASQAFAAIEKEAAVAQIVKPRLHVPGNGANHG